MITPPAVKMNTIEFKDGEGVATVVGHGKGKTIVYVVTSDESRRATIKSLIENGYEILQDGQASVV